METTKVFSSPELEQAYARAQKGLANYQARLDGISNDIKLLEKAFEASRFNVETWATAREGIEDQASSGSLDQIAHQLGWAKAGDRFRLIYRRQRWEGYIVIDDGIVMRDPGEYGSYATELEKPLIETSVETRLEMHRHLSALVLAVGRTADAALEEELSLEQEVANLKAVEALGELTEIFKAPKRATKAAHDGSET